MDESSVAGQVATRLSGDFNLNVSSNGTVSRRIVRLSVCRFCLDFLQFDGFRISGVREAQKKMIVDAFEISRFFEKFPMSLHTTRPLHTSDSAPLNEYAVGFPEISLKARTAAGWRCQNCGLNLSRQEHRRFLHTHHENGDRSDNTLSNLKVVCMECHAGEPCHAHMKRLSEYAEFLKIRRSL